LRTGGGAGGGGGGAQRAQLEQRVVTTGHHQHQFVALELAADGFQVVGDLGGHRIGQRAQRAAGQLVAGPTGLVTREPPMA
jgi:predicted signal transduction protein with EAL and GGDEF domain